MALPSSLGGRLFNKQVTYLGFHEGAKFSLGTSAYTKGSELSFFAKGEQPWPNGPPRYTPVNNHEIDSHWTSQIELYIYIGLPMSNPDQVHELTSKIIYTQLPTNIFDEKSNELQNNFYSSKRNCINLKKLNLLDR